MHDHLNINHDRMTPAADRYASYAQTGLPLFTQRRCDPV